MTNENNKQEKNKVVRFCEGAADTVFGSIRPFLSQLFSILEEGKIAKRFAVWAGILLTINALQWCFDFAQNPPEAFSGNEIAAIIGAVLTPLAGLTGALMKYGEQTVVIKEKGNYSKREEDRVDSNG